MPFFSTKYTEQNLRVTLNMHYCKFPFCTQLRKNIALKSKFYNNFLKIFIKKLKKKYSTYIVTF